MSHLRLHTFLLCGVCGMIGSTLSAADAELVTRDLFISFDSQPTDFAFTAKSNVGTTTGDDAFDSGLGISVGGRWSFTQSGSSLGLVIGGDLDVTSYQYENSAENLTFGARLIVGAGWAISDRWELLLEPTIEYGVASFTFPATQSYAAYEADGTFFGYGLRLNAIHRFTDRWAVMGALGWKRIDNDLSGDGIDLTLEQEGVSISIGLLYRLSAAPARVE
ncbi:MAG: MipA/OmpV family protein [Planctomycetes bacterium]|nr:MipA/OmpV family protein [Planctomycetota bacterium]